MSEVFSGANHRLAGHGVEPKESVTAPMRNPAAAAFAGSDAPHPMSPAPAWASGVNAGRFSQFMGGPPTSWPQGGDGAASFGAATSAGVSGDRKSVVWGTSVSVRVDLGGRRLIKKEITY